MLVRFMAKWSVLLRYFLFRPSWIFCPLWKSPLAAGLKVCGNLPGIFPMSRTKETSLLCRLQSQTLPDATQPIGKIHPFSKIAGTFEPFLPFWCLSGFWKLFIPMTFQNHYLELMVYILVQPQLMYP